MKFADVNSFLTLAATRDLDNPRGAAIVAAARAGHVPVHLVSSERLRNIF
jgi:hypothetical protein